MYREKYDSTVLYYPSAHLHMLHVGKMSTCQARRVSDSKMQAETLVHVPFSTLSLYWGSLTIAAPLVPNMSKRIRHFEKPHSSSEEGVS